MSLIDIGVSGLRVQQTALSVTGQNITNANSPGYSRQRINVVPQNAGTDGSLFRGAGARVQDVERITDEFATTQVRSDQSMRTEMATLSEQIQSVDGLLFSDSNGLDSAFDAFFSALNDANAAPNALPERQLVLDAADNLSNRFNRLNDELNARYQGSLDELKSATSEINELAESIAGYNRRLSELGEHGLSGAANQLLDQRDLALQSLSRLIGVKVVRQDEHQVNVFIGKGQALVLGTISQDMAMGKNQEIFLQGANGRAQPITQALTGGAVGGLLQFQKTVVNPAMQRLGQLAYTFAQTFNAEHQRGIDLQGQPGQDFFTDINSGTAPANRAVREDFLPGASGSISVRVVDASATVLSDYRLDFAEKGNGAFSIRRLSDDTLVLQGRHVGAAQNLSFDGLTVSLDAAGFQPGQAYRLTPLRQGAGDLTVALDAVSQIALASPARSSASVSNQGTAELNVGAILDPTHPILKGDGALSPPLLVRFISEDRFDLLDNRDPTAPVDLDPPLRSQRYVPALHDSLTLGVPNSARVYSDTQSVGQLQPVQIVQGTDGSLDNGYQDQQLNFTAASGSLLAPISVQIPAHASAAAAAEMLDRVEGVSATAYTDLFVDGVQRSTTGLGPTLLVGDEVLTDVRDLQDLVTRINASQGLKTSGIRAVLDGGVARLTQIAGEDLALKVSGDTDTGLLLRGAQGDRLTLSGAGLGEPAQIIGSRDLRSGYDFSIGGPYAVTLTVGSQSSQIVLDQSFANAQSLILSMQSQLDDAFGSSTVQAGLNNSGSLTLTTASTGAASTLLVAPNGAAVDALGLVSASAQGQDRFAATMVGGRIALLLDPERGLKVDGGGPFANETEYFRGDLGFELELTGRPAAGDEFLIDFNANGVLDNRNGLALAQLQNAPIIGDPAATMTQTFSALVEFVGAKANQAAIDQEAAEVLLAQSTARLESIAGVNLDEEAANLIRFEQGYNAAAQVISVARDVFNVLFNAVS